MEDTALINRAEVEPRPQEAVERERERRAHEFRAAKRANSPDIRAALIVIRDEPGIWEKVEPTEKQQRSLEEGTAITGETHRVGASLHANIYREQTAAALYDLALFEATQKESNFFKKQIKEGNNYSPITVVGGGGVYGSIFSAAALKENPDNPPFGFDGGRRRGGIWGVSGDVTLDRAWWRMNSKNRPEKVEESPLPGGRGNQNSLGSEVQNLQVPDISSAQYPTNNEMGRILTHDNFLSNNLVVNARLVKVRPNREAGRPGKYQQEYEDSETGERFFVWSDIVVQATGLGREKLGFSETIDITQEVLEEVERDLREGRTPKLLTFTQLVEATTANREIKPSDFKRFGIIGTGDTSRVIEEYFGGIGGIDPGIEAQRGFVEEIIEFGKKRTREELARSERPRYTQRITEFGRENGEESFARFRGIEGRVVAVGLRKKGGLTVFYQQVDQTPEGEVRSIAKINLPRLVTAAGFQDESAIVYSGLTAEVVNKPNVNNRVVERVLLKPGSTIFYEKSFGVSRVDVEEISEDQEMVKVIVVDSDGKAQAKVINTQSLTSEEFGLFNTLNISKIEIAGQPLNFEPFFDKDFDSEIPVAEKARGYEIYKIGACTNLPITDKEKKLPAYRKVTENTKSIFRFEERTVAFSRSLARRVRPVGGALNQLEYRVGLVKLADDSETDKRSLLTVPIEAKTAGQKLSPNLKTDVLLKQLALSNLTCVFPEDLSEIRFGVKRRIDPQRTALNIEFSSPLPRGGDWQIIDQFFAQPLVGRLLLRLTRSTTNAAEISIGLKEGRVDIRKTSAKTVKNSEESTFLQKYPSLTGGAT